MGNRRKCSSVLEEVKIYINNIDKGKTRTYIEEETNTNKKSQ